MRGGVAGPVDPAERERIYSRLQQLWYEEAVGIPLYQQINVRAYRDTVHGYVPNPMLPDAWEDLRRQFRFDTMWSHQKTGAA